MILILVGVSCSGKTIVLNALVAEHNFQRLTTTTTRPIRAGEVDGKDYFFVSEEEFDRRNQAGNIILPTVYREYQYGMPDTYLRPSTDPNRRYVTILTPDAIPVIKAKAEELSTKQRIIAVYIEPESQDFLAQCYTERSGLPFNAEKHTRENLPISSLKHLCDHVVVNRRDRMDEMIQAVLRIVAS